MGAPRTTAPRRPLSPAAAVGCLALAAGAIVAVRQGRALNRLSTRNVEGFGIWREISALMRLRIEVLERSVGELREAGSTTPLRDKAEATLDLARARLVNAEAEEKERELAAQLRPRADDGAGPVVADACQVDWSPQPPGETLVRLTLTDGAGRTYRLLLPPSVASSTGAAMVGAAAELVDGYRGSA